jgi:hypothetical protein
MRQDPFTDTQHAVTRLYKEWVKHPQLIVAVDFDDTVFDFHQKGDTHDRVINLLKRCNAENFYIVTFTASHPGRYPLIEARMKEIGIEVHSMNQNPIELPFGNHGKIYYNILLDDRAGLGQAVETLEAVLDMIDFAKAYPALAKILNIEELMDTAFTYKIVMQATPKLPVVGETIDQINGLILKEIEVQEKLCEIINRNS